VGVMSDTQGGGVGARATPATEHTYAEFLQECADALTVPAWDWRERNRHLEVLQHHLSAPSTPPQEADLLQEVKTEFERQLVLSNPMHAPLLGSCRCLVVRLQTVAAANGGRQYLYHGTVYGRVKAIAKAGLRPGAKPVWREDGLRGYSDEAVFFSITWRGAAQWAEIAHLHSRGPRAGIARKPVVIRVPAATISAEPDTRAAAPGCVMVRGVVDVGAADVLRGDLKGYPSWEPLRRTAFGAYTAGRRATPGIIS
jgi:hypothetical protein